MVDQEQLRIGICGGGVSGLCLARTLAKYGTHLQVDVYDRGANFGEIGAGVTIYGRTLQVIEALGLTQQLAAIDTSADAETVVGFEYRRSDRPDGFTYATRTLGKGQSFHRAEFLDLFAKDFPSSVRVHFSKRLESCHLAQVENDATREEVVMKFTDGTSATCDVLVGCDGVKSPTRVSMCNLKASELGDGSAEAETVRGWAKARFTGHIFHRQLIPMKDVDEAWKRRGGEGLHRVHRTRLLYCGKNQTLVGYAIQNKTMLNVATIEADPSAEGSVWPSSKWVEEVDGADIVKQYEGWEPEALCILDCLKRPSRWATHAMVPPLPSYTWKRIALVGDAAHAMTPYQGAGANQAIEDTFVLGRLLSHPSTNQRTFTHALEAYDTIRRPRANEVVLLSKRAGMLAQFTSELGEDYPAIAKALTEPVSWIVGGKVEDDVQKAFQLFTDAIKKTVNGN